MKKGLFLTVCLGLALATATAPQAQSANATARKKRVAVFDFDYATVHAYSRAIFGSDIDVGRGVSDLLVTMLVKDGTYSVIERKNLDKILGEQNFSNSDRANPASAAKIGKLLGVDAIIVGSITQFGNDTKNTGVGGVGAGLGKVGLGGFSRKESKAIVAIDARIVDIDTAEILAVAEGKGESKRTSTSMTGGGGGWGGFGAGGVNFGCERLPEHHHRRGHESRHRAAEHERHRGQHEADHPHGRRGGPGGGGRWRPDRHQRRRQGRIEDRRSDERRARVARDQGSGDRQGHSPHDCPGGRDPDHRRRRRVGRRGRRVGDGIQGGRRRQDASRSKHPQARWAILEAASCVPSDCWWRSR